MLAIDSTRLIRIPPLCAMLLATTAACGGPTGMQAPAGSAPPGPDSPGHLTFSPPPGGPFSGSVTVTITSSTPGAVIRYTHDSQSVSPSIPYAGPIVVYPAALYEMSMVAIVAVEVVDGVAGPPVMATYALTPAGDPTPTFSPPGGTFGTAQAVTISTSVPTATVFYTTDGSAPVWGVSRAYDGPVVVSETTTLRAMATLYNDETPVAAATYRF